MHETVKAAVERAGLDARPGDIEAWTRRLPAAEVTSRVESLGRYLRQVNLFNADGVALTPAVLSHLGQPGEFGALLAELDRLRAETRGGRFDIENPLQRDLELTRFKWKTARADRARQAADDLYGAFTELRELPPPEEPVRFALSEEHLIEVKRAAHEAVGFLRFLRDFRTRTARPIVVVGNDKAQYWGGGYGRMFVVEPLERHLEGDFAVRYDRVASHGTMRLNVPSAFPKDFVRGMGAGMPHVVVVDGAGPPRSRHATRFSRAVRGYANWFAVFNDLRSQGRHRRYEADTPLPADHLSELRKWDDYVLVREEIEEWVSPGPTYRLALWGPEPAERALLADVEVRWPEPPPADDMPTVVLANPIVYRTDVASPGRVFGKVADDLPDFMRHSRPYYFDAADKLVKESILMGFGAHGFETRVQGPTTRSFVTEVQRHIAAEVATMLGDH